MGEEGGGADEIRRREGNPTTRRAHESRERRQVANPRPAASRSASACPVPPARETLRSLSHRAELGSASRAVFSLSPPGEPYSPARQGCLRGARLARSSTSPRSGSPAPIPPPLPNPTQPRCLLKPSLRKKHNEQKAHCGSPSTASRASSLRTSAYTWVVRMDACPSCFCTRRRL